MFALIGEKLQETECNVILRLQGYNTPGVQGSGGRRQPEHREKIKLPLHA